MVEKNTSVQTLLQASEFKKILDFGWFNPAQNRQCIMEVVLKQENIYEFHTPRRLENYFKRSKRAQKRSS